MTDTKLQPATGYTDAVRSYDAAGRRSNPATKCSSASRSKTAAPTWTPAGITHGIVFFVDGKIVYWSDTCSGPLRPGERKTLAANNGPSGTATWIAPPSVHTLEAQVDDLHRITQSGGGAHTMQKQVTVAAGP